MQRKLCLPRARTSNCSVAARAAPIHNFWLARRLGQPPSDLCKQVLTPSPPHCRHCFCFDPSPRFCRRCHCCCPLRRRCCRPSWHRGRRGHRCRTCRHCRSCRVIHAVVAADAQLAFAPPRLQAVCCKAARPVCPADVWVCGCVLATAGSALNEDFFPHIRTPASAKRSMWRRMALGIHDSGATGS